MIQDGTTLVEVRALEPDGAPPPLPPPPPPPGEIYAQAGAFTLAENAERLRARLTAAGVGPVLLRSDSAGGRALYRVRIGPIESVAAYDALVARLHALGVANVVLAPN